MSSSLKTSTCAAHQKTDLKKSSFSIPREPSIGKTLNTDKAVETLVSAKTSGYKMGTQKPAKTLLPTEKAMNSPLITEKPVLSQSSNTIKKPPIQQAAVSVDKSSTQAHSTSGVAIAAPLVPRSASAAVHLGPDDAVPQSYRNAIMGTHATTAATSTAFSQPCSPNLAYSQPPITSLPMFLPQTSTSSISPIPTFSFGMLDYGVLQNESHLSGMGDVDSSRGLPNDPSFLTDITNIDILKRSCNLSDEFPPGFPPHGVLADEFPHLDIINDLLDDEYGIPSAAQVGPLFQSFSNGPHHLTGQFDTSSCRFERPHSYHDEFQRSYGGGFDLSREMVQQQQPNLQPFVNGHINGLIPNHWQMAGADFSYPSWRNLDNNVRQYPDYSNLMMGVNGYTIYRPSNGQ
uniref:TNF receptor-associated factor homolog 1a-like n=1 Tax=Erigeron canadensis TaxID=72917 RepID=UPI001CB91E24|nr:TNF receptor-associated factor homolog 1a-like [Erigeron canadensis]